MARHQPADPHPRRTDARRRRRRQSRSPQADSPARRPGDGDPAHQLRPPRSPRDERPGARHARGAHRGRTLARASDPGIDSRARTRRLSARRSRRMTTTSASLPSRGLQPPGSLALLASKREYGVAILLALTITVVAIINPTFLDPGNLRN